MMSTVEYLGELRTSAIHLRSGNSLLTDAPIDNEGKGEAFSPTDLVATALASCMLTVMGIYAQARGIKLEGTRVGVEKIMASDPRRISRIAIRMTLPGATIAESDRKNLERTARTCPVLESLHPDLEKDITFLWD